MVRKNEKRGVHSGNTLRASNSKYNRLYRSQAVLVRNLKNSSTTDTLLDELSISSDGIEYSLNKKGRWIVPQLLKEHIFCNRKLSSDDINVQLTESHKIKRNAKCIGFYATKGPFQKVIPRNKTYFNAKSLQPRCDRKKRKSRNRNCPMTVTEFNEEDEEKQLPPELNIEVFYPSPMTSSITHNPKYIKNWRENGNQSKNGRRKKRVRMNSKCVKDFMDDFEYIFSDEENDENIDIIDQDPSSPQQPMELLLDDIFFHASKMQKLCSQKRNKTNSRSEENNNTKSNIMYLDRNASARNKENLQKTGEQTITESTTRYSKMLPTCVILSSADTQPLSLRENFGTSYLECPCFPRKFTIDITKMITTFAKNSRIFQGKGTSFDFTASVIFEYDMGTMLDHADGNVYKIYLNLKAKQNSVQIETIPDFTTMTVDEVIQRTLFFIETLPYDCFREHVNVISKTTKDVNFQNLDVCLQTKTDTYYPSYNRIYQEIYQNQEVWETDNKQLEVGSWPSSTCYICFESIAIGEKSATALHACGHWFCNDCWHDHVQSRIDMGYEKITCPEYKCESVVDSGTLMTLVNVQYVEQLAKRQHDSKVTKFKETKWCPNPTCGRVLKIENLTMKSLNVKCGCGKTMCFDCLQPAHWPASCESSVGYWTKLNASNMRDVLPADFNNRVDVYGKNCPRCYKFIEKNGGCNMMSCVCGALFCWACLKLWENHGRVGCNQSGDRENALKKEIKHISSEHTLSAKGHSKLYRIAIHHRANRHPWKIRVMKSNVWSLSTKLKYFLRKYGDKYGMELKEYLNDKEHLQNDFKKIPVFLSSMVDLYVEINYVTEYTAVYLQDDEKGHRSSLIPVLERLSYLADNIFENFKPDMNKDIKAILPNLWKLRHYSKCSIDQLVRLVFINKKSSMK